MPLNYFVCTLGQAELPSVQNKKFKTIGELIESQSANNPDLPAAGFAYPDCPRESQQVRLYTFRDIERLCDRAADYLVKSLGKDGSQDGSTVALLSPSTPEFLFVWLALIRLGYSVLLVAPQNHAEAIMHLCNICNVQTLVFDGIYNELAVGTTEEARKVGKSGPAILQIPFTIEELHSPLSPGTKQGPSCFRPKRRQPQDIAYFFHTSGTSSGLPKPIPQSHNAAVGVHPSVDNGRDVSTFSTTPLYHGGIADVFRAWTSDALIWLYPGQTLGREKRINPITASNILTCLRTITMNYPNLPPIKFFSSVPYILQMMADDEHGLQYLQSMDCVGVGGAALPTNVGNKLVARDVNLVSRYGSAECGFLLSSHRDYRTDKEWQYLRADTGAECLSFEPQSDDKFELVVRPGWPHMAKQNRPDGSYATSDLLTPHTSITNAWRYDSRADSQLTLITGKKFDPAPLEGDIASSELLDDVYVFGNGRPFPGALLFRSQNSKDLDDEVVIEKLAPFIEGLNAKAQSHARIPRNMLVPIAYGHNQLRKSSKGTILRNKTEEVYGEIINGAYGRLGSTTTTDVSDEDLLAAIQKSICAILGKNIDFYEDLFAYGMDSLGSIQIRYYLQRLVPEEYGDLPMTIVEDQGTIEKLTAFVWGARNGKQHPNSIHDETQTMLALSEKYSQFSDSPTSDIGNTIVLTGATGALGAHLLAQYRASPATRKIYCLVRGADARAARCRVDKALRSRKLPPLPTVDSVSQCSTDEKTMILPTQLHDPKLGLSPPSYATLQHETTHIIHAAWAVNFRWRLPSFERDHIQGLRHLLDLALASPRAQKPAFIFCSSVASVSAAPAAVVPEEISTNPTGATEIGYGRSKWVAEAVCDCAARARPDLPVAVLRIGQLAGDSVHGIWNHSEAWPLMLGSVYATGCLPGLHEQALDWLPVDLAARAVGEVAEGMGRREDAGAARVLHVLNRERDVMWRDALQWLKEMGEVFEVVEPAVWVQRLGRLEGKAGRKRDADGEVKELPALRLLGMWRERYGSAGGGGAEKKECVFADEQAKSAALVLREVGPVRKEYFVKLWTWIRENATG